MTSDVVGESFQSFKDSFAYGSRNDLNFKFLKGFSDRDAAQFFQELLWKLMEVMQLPRLLLTPHLMGRPVGAPGDQIGQRQTLLAALELLEGAEGGGTIVELPGRYRPVRGETE